MHSAFSGTDESVPYTHRIRFPLVGNAFMHSAFSGTDESVPYTHSIRFPLVGNAFMHSAFIPGYSPLILASILVRA